MTPARDTALSLWVPSDEAVASGRDASKRSMQKASAMLTMSDGHSMGTVDLGRQRCPTQPMPAPQSESTVHWNPQVPSGRQSKGAVQSAWE
ncbi:MAG: hypothetical protein CVU63_00495 [Deltaproteobacteria bacterium HGW-Deltaproteobacteria-20]|nr:MAG: hypothetical protein CVU63_00495 [Deltaproteobacteria bacterium HGW-Deltaproteobacteria-20]